MVQTECRKSQERFWSSHHVLALEERIVRISTITFELNHLNFPNLIKNEMRKKCIWSYAGALQTSNIATVINNQQTATKLCMPIAQILLNNESMFNVRKKGNKNCWKISPRAASEDTPKAADQSQRSQPWARWDWMSEWGPVQVPGFTMQALNTCTLSIQCVASGDWYLCKDMKRYRCIELYLMYIFLT